MRFLFVNKKLPCHKTNHLEIMCLGHPTSLPPVPPFRLPPPSSLGMHLPAELSGIPDGTTQFVDCSTSLMAADGTLKAHLFDQVGGRLAGWVAFWLGRRINGHDGWMK